jgi:hypothetical protein
MTERDGIIDGFKEAIVRLRKATPGSDEHQQILADLQMKQGLMQYVAMSYQMRACEATERSAKYMLRTVIIAIVAAFISFSSTVVLVVSSLPK